MGFSQYQDAKIDDAVFWALQLYNHVLHFYLRHSLHYIMNKYFKKKIANIFPGHKRDKYKQINH